MVFVDPSVVQGALEDIADAEFSPRQRQVLVEKYRKARGSLQTVSQTNETFHF